MGLHTHLAHDVLAPLNQRRWRWFNVATTSCAQWVSSFSGQGKLGALTLVINNHKFRDALANLGETGHCHQNFWRTPIVHMPKSITCDNKAVNFSGIRMAPCVDWIIELSGRPTCRYILCHNTVVFFTGILIWFYLSSDFTLRKNSCILLCFKYVNIDHAENEHCLRSSLLLNSNLYRWNGSNKLSWNQRTTLLYYSN